LINIDQHLRHISIDPRTVEPAAMSAGALSRPAVRLSAFYAAIFLVAGIQLPFWPVWLATRGLTPQEIGIVLAAAIWAKFLATPVMGSISDRSGSRRVVMGALAGAALVSYAALFSATGFWVLVSLNLVALTAQSALMPLGDTATLAVARSNGLDYGRIRVWGSVAFILASLASGAVLASSSGEEVLPLVTGASALLLLTCVTVPRFGHPTDGSERSRE
jgi:MFS transporter, PPP family, 3-phenylpropionic acid transporter